MLSYEAEALVVRSEDSLVSPDDVQPFKSVIKRQDHWLGKPVQTEKGDSLGKVTDVIIDTDLERVAKIHVQAFFGPERIISREDIVKISRSRIIVHESLEVTKGSVVIAETPA